MIANFNDGYLIYPNTQHSPFFSKPPKSASMLHWLDK